MILKEGHARMCMNVRGSVTGTALSFVDLVFRTGTLVALGVMSLLFWC